MKSIVINNISLLDACDKSSKLADLLRVISQVLHDESVDNQEVISCVGIAWDLNSDINNQLSLLSNTKTTITPTPTPAENIDLPHGSTIGERIREIRKLREMTVEELAREINVLSEYIRIVERGVASPISDTIIPLANALKCDPMWLLAGSQTEIAEES